MHCEFITFLFVHYCVSHLGRWLVRPAKMGNAPHLMKKRPIFSRRPLLIRLRHNSNIFPSTLFHFDWPLNLTFYCDLLWPLNLKMAGIGWKWQLCTGEINLKYIQCNQHQNRISSLNCCTNNRQFHIWYNISNIKYNISKLYFQFNFF